jgi:hypothetical protein
VVAATEAPSGIHADLLACVPVDHPHIVGYIMPGGNFLPRAEAERIAWREIIARSKTYDAKDRPERGLA